MDVFAIMKEKDVAYVNYLMVRNGAVIQTQTSKVEAQLDETTGEIISFTVAQLRSIFNSDAKESVVHIQSEYLVPEVIITIPKGGDRKKLLDLSEKNVIHYLEEIRNRERLQLNIKSKNHFM